MSDEKKKPDCAREDGQDVHRAAHEAEKFPNHIERMDLWKCPECASMVAGYVSSCPTCRLPRPLK